MRFLYFLTILLISSLQIPIFGQDFNATIQVTDGPNSQSLVLGLDPNGTEGYDSGLDILAPPPPPAGAFDARFNNAGESFLTDIRDNLINEKQFHMTYAVSSGNGPIILTWDDIHLDSLGTFFIVDDIIGSLFGPVDMTTTNNLTVTDPLILSGLRILTTPYEWVNAPSELIANVFDSPFYVELIWNDNSSNELGFVIERDKNHTGFVVLDTVGTDTEIYLDTNVTAINTYDYRMFAFSANKISDYSDTSQVVVPVELSSFTATLLETSVKLNWTTASELNNRGFEIERFSSSLGNSWEKIAFIQGKGTTTEVSNYQYLDDFKNFSIKGVEKYRLKQIDFDGMYEYSDIIEVNVDFVPDQYVLYQNFPNPFNPITTIRFELPDNVKVTLKVYDILGQEVAAIINNKEMEEGIHKINWEPTNYASGIYFYQIRARNYIAQKKMILLK